MTKTGKGLRIKQKLEEAEVPKNKGHNEKTAVAMGDDGSPPWSGGALEAGQGQRPAVQGAHVTYNTVDCNPAASGVCSA